MRTPDGEVIVTEKDKKIKKVLHRLLDEECTKLKNISERISTLNHQTEHYDKMHECSQNLVDDKMFSLMLENGWRDWIKELKEELALL